LLVGLNAPDDAAVYQLNENQAAVLTVDFFAPLVDEPYDYGAIAATNAMSDIYAMGGDVILALNVAAFPEDFPRDIIGEILQGGSDKVREAGGVIAGGHTTIDDEPKYGLSVMGIVQPSRVFTKGAARPGDALFLTKPLGTGIITTAAMQDVASPEELEAAVQSMTTLNRDSSRLAREIGVHALTDISGFGLLGHSYEVAAASGVRLRLEAQAVPALPGALDHAAAGITTGGEARNRDYLADKVTFSQALDEALERLLFDPQTSGGLLFSLPEAESGKAVDAFNSASLPLWRIGTVTEGSGVEVVA